MPASAVFHFFGRVPAIELTSDHDGSAYGPYLGGDIGHYRSFFASRDYARWAFCVDNKMFKDWNDLNGERWSTTYYVPVVPTNAFPSAEASWIPASVRYTATDAYKAPFGNTDYGRSEDTQKEARTYLVYEKHGDPCTMLMLR